MTTLKPGQCQWNIRVPKKLRQHVKMVAAVEELSDEELMTKALAHYLGISVDELTEDFNLDTAVKVAKVQRAVQGRQR